LAIPEAQTDPNMSRPIGRRLVVLDDDPAVLRTIRLMARRIGMEAKTCQTLTEFETAIASFSPDFLLVDLMMPGVDGIDVIRRIGPRAQSPLLVMSGADKRTFEASREVLKCGDVAIAGFLKKPFGSAELARALSSSLTIWPSTNSCHYAAPLPAILSPDEFAKAVMSSGLEPYYQPIFHPDGHTLIGFEALARVKGKDEDFFAQEYIDQLIANTLLSEIMTKDIIQRALDFMSNIGRNNNLTISVNLFGSHAIADGFREWLLEQCRKNGIATQRLILELSEATVCGLTHDELRKVTQLRLAGFGLSIDDFGTGHSSLGRLASLPFSELKIDKSFCLALPRSQAAAAVVEASLGLAARLDMKVTAEGVETEEIAAALARLGCDALQGHFFGRAMPGEVVKEWLSGTEHPVAA